MRWSRVRGIAIGALVGLISAGCSWGQLGGDASRAGYVPLETGITLANVNQLQRTSQTPFDFQGAFLANGFLYTIPTGVTDRIVTRPVDQVGCIPSCVAFRLMVSGRIAPDEFTGLNRFAVVGNDAFVLSHLDTANPPAMILEAFDARGARNCTAGLCRAMWSATRPGIGAEIAVADGRVFESVWTDVGAELRAYGTSAAQCGADLAACRPLWSTPSNFGTALAATTKYVSMGSAVYPVTGPTTCVAAGCDPLLIRANQLPASMAEGWIYTSAGRTRFDDRSSCFTGSASTTAICPIDWVPAARTSFVATPPTLTGANVTFIEQPENGATEAAVRVFPRDGGTDCAGTPRVCQPVADLVPDGVSKGVSATRDLIFVTSDGVAGTPIGWLSAFDARLEQNCGGTPKRCTPLWSQLTYSFGLWAPAIANGHIAVSGRTGGGVIPNPGVGVFSIPPAG